MIYEHPTIQATNFYRVYGPQYAIVTCSLVTIRMVIIQISACRGSGARLPLSTKLVLETSRNFLGIYWPTQYYKNL